MTDKDTIGEDIVEHAKETNPAKFALQMTGPTVPSRAPAVATTNVFRESTRSQLKNIASIVFHEMERLILRFMPRGEEAPIFGRLLQQRVTLIDSQYAIEEVTSR